MLRKKTLILAMLSIMAHLLVPAFAEEPGYAEGSRQHLYSMEEFYNEPEWKWNSWKAYLDHVIESELYKTVPVDLSGTKYSPLMAVVLFTVSRDGKIRDVRLRSKSGDVRFDKFAIAAVQAAEKRIKPFPVHQIETEAVFTVRLMYPESSTKLPYYFFFNDSIAPDFNP